MILSLSVVLTATPEQGRASPHDWVNPPELARAIGQEPRTSLARFFLQGLALGLATGLLIGWVVFATGLLTGWVVVNMSP
jgi:hypothetical protein